MNVNNKRTIKECLVRLRLPCIICIGWQSILKNNKKGFVRLLLLCTISISLSIHSPLSTEPLSCASIRSRATRRYETNNKNSSSSRMTAFIVSLHRAFTALVRARTTSPSSSYSLHQLYINLASCSLVS